MPARSSMYFVCFSLNRLLLLLLLLLSKTDTNGTMEYNTKSAFAENYLFETSDSVIQKR